MESDRGKKQDKYEYPSIDKFRMIAALFVVAIHVAPLSSYHEKADFFVTYCLGRMAVPFFLVVTGYFTLGSESSTQRSQKVKKMLLHMGKLYGMVTLFYLPINFYAGNLPKNLGEAVKQIVFDGTFYHLWYIPGVMLGSLIVCGLLSYLGERITVLVTLLLYLIGLFGDSYYGMAIGISGVKEIYQVLFSFSSYTRNGIFFTPIFLCMGAILGKRKYCISKEKGELGILVSLIGLLLEGEITRNLGLQRHNSMYFCLLPFTFFLISLLTVKRRKVEAGEVFGFVKLRQLSLWIYLLHPLCIVGVRGMAKVLNLKEVFVDNSLVFYILVCIGSLIVSIIVQHLINLVKNEVRRKNDGIWEYFSGIKTGIGTGNKRRKQSMD